MAKLVVERLRLRQRSRKAVQDKPVCGIRMIDPVRDDSDDNIVRYEFPAGP